MAGVPQLMQVTVPPKTEATHPISESGTPPVTSNGTSDSRCSTPINQVPFIWGCILGLIILLS